MTEQVNDASTGASFTANTKAPKPTTTISEGTGQITSDSLAAESLNSGGSFAGGNAVPDKVSSNSTTANTTDKSAATILPAAADATKRDDGDVSLGGSTGGATGGSSDSSAAGAPSYASAAGSTGENSKPKGTNITEGGFDSSAPNASFNNDIGGKNDPGRVAEDTFAKSNAKSGADAGFEGANQAKVDTGKGGFENLKEESA